MKLSELAAALNAKLEGDGDMEITGVRGLEQAGLRLSVVLAADDRRPPSEPSYP